MNKDEKKFDIGVVVGRFQIDQLHEGHLALLDHVTSNHNKVIVFLGVASGEHKEDQALGFATRSKMIKSAFPTVETEPLNDMKDDRKWSKQLDDKIRSVFHHGTAVLYGGRKSFIPHYHGKHPTRLFEFDRDEVNATSRRHKIAREVRDSEDFRAGILYHAANTYAKSFQCVDLAIIQYPIEEEQLKKDSSLKQRPMAILLGRKPHEDKYRFPGGHVEPSDISLESAALREGREEITGVELNIHPTYVTSMRVDDWRYRKSKNKIMTALYLTEFIYGRPKAADDLESCKWITVNELLKPGGIIEHIEEEHRPLMVALLGHLGQLKEQEIESIA